MASSSPNTRYALTEGGTWLSIADPFQDPSNEASDEGSDMDLDSDSGSNVDDDSDVHSYQPSNDYSSTSLQESVLVYMDLRENWERNNYQAVSVALGSAPIPGVIYALRMVWAFYIDSDDYPAQRALKRRINASHVGLVVGCVTSPGQFAGIICDINYEEAESLAFDPESDPEDASYEEIDPDDMTGALNPTYKQRVDANCVELRMQEGSRVKLSALGPVGEKFRADFTGEVFNKGVEICKARNFLYNTRTFNCDIYTNLLWQAIR